MKVTRIPQVEVLGRDSLARAWVSKEKSLESFWPFGSSMEGVVSSINQGRSLNIDRRKSVSEVMRKQYLKAGLSPPDSLTAFEQGAHSVTTGHQLQLMGGPAYFHYKILSSIRWVKQLQAKGHAAVPVFWMASEDHDFVEIAAVHGVSAESFVWNRPASASPHFAVGRMPWTADDERGLHDWMLSQGIDSCEEAIGVDETLATRVRRWVHDFFGDEGVLILDGDDPTLKGLANHLFVAEWAGEGIAPSVMSATSALEAQGWKAQLKPRVNNVFHLSNNGERTRADRWATNEPPDAWRSISPVEWSPNASLRPLYQEFLLESAAVVGGPGEVAYWLQLGEAFQFHGLNHPALLMRDGGLVLSDTASELVGKLGWDPRKGWWRGPEASAAWVSSQLASESSLQSAWKDWESALQDYAAGVGRESLPATKGTLVQMEKELLTLKKKWRKQVRLRHAGYCQALEESFDKWITPNGLPQERQLNALVLAQCKGGWSNWKKAWLESVAGAEEPQFLLF